MITTKRIIEVLKKVPEKKFQIAGLASTLLTNGKVDFAKCMEKQAELNIAIAEVKSNIIGTRAAIDALHGIDREIPIEEDLE